MFTNPSAPAVNTLNLSSATGSTLVQVSENFYYGYTTLYGGVPAGYSDMILMLTGYRNFLNSLYGLGTISPTAPVGVISGSWAAANAMSASGYI